MNKCIGCGSILQTNNYDMEGYTRDINNSFCERCFRIKHYSDYKLISKDNNEFITILNNIGSTDSLVVLVVDLFNIPKILEDISKYLSNKILLVLTKRDILPLSVYDANLVRYFENYKLNIIDTIIISSTKNYNFDLLFDMIRKYQTNKNVYVVGFTNAGKSTMINKLLYNYTDKDPVITTSMLPSTTIDSIEIEVDESLTLIDTPGLLEENNIINVIDVKTLKKIVPTKEIKPKTYQIKAKQTIFVDELLRIDCKNTNSLTFYFANTLIINRVYKETSKLKELIYHRLEVDDDSDIVITGLGFIKVVNKDNIELYAPKGVDIYVRKSLI